MVGLQLAQNAKLDLNFFHKSGSQINVNKDATAIVLWFVVQVKQNGKRKFSWFMQNGAPSHTDLKSRKLVNGNFGNRTVGKNFSVSWPPYSPDLTPADF